MGPGAARLPWRTPKSTPIGSQSWCCEESSHSAGANWTSTTTALPGSCFRNATRGSLAPLGGRSFVGDAISAYHDLLFDPDPAVHGPAGVAWSTWEAATITLEADEGLIADFSDPTFALAFARIENHYFFHRGWFGEGQLIANAGRLADIPGVIVQGRYDVATPAVTAYDLHQAWPTAQFTIVPVAGHAFSEPGILHALVAATDRFARRDGLDCPKIAAGVSRALDRNDVANRSRPPIRVAGLLDLRLPVSLLHAL